jgi:pantetheine-phosphate adenylyltransferase
MRKAIFPGSFNPFTPGHEDIVERGLAIFDEVVIAIGCNPDKPEAMQKAETNRAIIAERYGTDPRVSVIIYHGLTVDAAKENGAEFILRGVRSHSDYEYEMNMADVNRRLSGIDTVILTARPELACFSSSIFRELERYGKTLRNPLNDKQ